jgi:hypothetical protein
VNLEFGSFRLGTRANWSVGRAPLKLKEIWAIRVRLQVFRRTRELALFDLGIDSKLRACDLLKLKVRDVCHGERVAARAIVVQQKTSRPRAVRDDGVDADRFSRLDCMVKSRA